MTHSSILKFSCTNEGIGVLFLLFHCLQQSMCIAVSPSVLQYVFYRLKGVIMAL